MAYLTTPAHLLYSNFDFCQILEAQRVKWLAVRVLGDWCHRGWGPWLIAYILPWMKYCPEYHRPGVRFLLFVPVHDHTYLTQSNGLGKRNFCFNLQKQRKIIFSANASAILTCKCSDFVHPYNVSLITWFYSHSNGLGIRNFCFNSQKQRKIYFSDNASASRLRFY